MSPNMIEVLNDFNVPSDEWKKVLLSDMSKRNEGGVSALPKDKIRNIEPQALDLPETFYSLADAPDSDAWKEIAMDYLIEDRGIDPSQHPFYLSRKTDIPHLKKWFGRVIYPVYKGNKLIYYQGRDLTGKAQKKYESPAVSKDKVIYGFDKLFDGSDLPLYIVEGWFDAAVIDGVAILGNELSDAQIEWLNRSPKKKVYIPDRFGDGKLAGERALKLGWHISTPDIGQCKDMNDAVKKYGKLYVMKTIADNTATGFEAKMKLGVFCE
jgi:hypothetical protein